VAIHFIAECIITHTKGAKLDQTFFAATVRAICVKIFIETNKLLSQITTK